MTWTSREVRRLRRPPIVADDWDTLSQELRQFQVHERPQDADSGDIEFCTLDSAQLYRQFAS